MRWIDALPPQSRHGLGVALLAFGNIGFSAKAVIIKLAYRHEVDSYSLLSLRMLFSIPFYILTAFYLSRRSANVRLSPRQWAYTALLGVIGYYGASLLDFLGLQYISASMERLILYTYPTMVLVMSVLLFKKKIAAAQYWALLLTYTGVLFAFSGEAAAGVQRNLLTGGLLVFACAFLYAIYVVFAGEMVQKVGSLKFSCYAMMAASVAVLLHTWFHNKLNIFHFKPEVYNLSIWLALIATVLPTFMVAEGIRICGANNAAIIGFAGPVSTILLGHVYLGEAITGSQLLGTAIVVAGVLLISWKRS